MRAQVVLLAALSAVTPGRAGPQGVFQTGFQERPLAPAAPRAPQTAPRAPQTAPARGLAPRRPAPRPTQQPDRRETTTHVEILKQINEHNEDGSYTYGYEGSDGSFKLETRFADGRVQGKYGYIDVNGEVKIIEYGADAMGFQPTGDLPDGIIIPEPVQSNCTDAQGNDCDYNDYDSYYDYDQESKQEDSRREIVNRARASASEQAGNTQRINLNQNRGQQISAPITPAPLPRQQTAAAPLRSRPAPPPRPAFRPAPAAPAFRPAAPAAPQPFLPTPPPPRAPKNPGSSPRNPSRGRQSVRAGGRLQAQAPRAQAPRAQAPRAQAPSNAAAFPPSSQGFSNFPARTGGAPPARTRPAAPRQAPPPPRQSPRPAPALPPPSFQTSFNQQPAFPARPARPALTFQEDRPSPGLPASALEVVDFNELLGVFQQGSPRQQAAPQRFAPPAGRGSGRALPGVFQSANFPVRSY